MKHYDFVVVGAGCAGLAAALELTQNGKKTLLIEQHNIPGGCASGFVRGRFEFDPSLHELCGVGPEDKPANTRKLLNKYGVKINWCRVDDCFRVISKYSDGTDMDVTMPSGKEQFIDKMEEYVPGSKESIVNMFTLFDEVEEGLEKSSVMSGKELFQNFPNLLSVGSYNCKKVFDALNIPPKAQDILAVYWSYLGVDMNHLSFLHYASMVNSYVKNGAYIPSHTSHEISVAMLERFRECGGEAWFNCRANEFVFKNGKCCGVKTTLGEVSCNCVLANINPDIIYGKMMDKNLVPEREKKLSTARAQKYGARMFTVYMGLDKTPEELGIKDYSIFLCGTSDSEKEYKSLAEISTNRYFIFLCYNIANPEFSEKGTSVCSFTTFFSSPKDWNNLKPEDYSKQKTKIANIAIDLLKEKAGIDLRDHIEEISIASPMTFARYLGVPEGSVYGYETRDWDDIISRTLSMDNDYPVEGLIPIGTSGLRGDGYSSAYACGEILSKLALRKYSNGGKN